MRTSPNAARALPAAVIWTIAALTLVLVGPPLSATRLLGAGLLAIVPAVLIVLADRPVRSGLLASVGVLLAAWVLLGAGSAVTLGTAVGGITTWAAVAVARSHAGSRVRGLAHLLTALGLVLLLAPAAGPAGPRTFGAALALTLGHAVGERSRPQRPVVAGASSTTSTTSASSTISTISTVLLARVGIGLLIVLAVVRSIIDLDAPAARLLLAVRRAASLVLPTGPGVGGAVASSDLTTASLLVLPWLLPLVGAGLALVMTRRDRARDRTRDEARSAALARRSALVPPRALPGDVTLLIAAGLVATALADLIGVNWPLADDAGSVLRWPARHLETLLWAALAVALTAKGHWRPRADPGSTAVAVVTGLLLLTVLFSEWRVDGVALRPALLAVPAVFLGLAVLVRGGGARTGHVAGGIALAGVPVLGVGMVIGMVGHGPSRSGARSFIPGDAVLLVEGQRLAGVLPDAGQLGLVAAAIGLAGALLVLLPRTPPLPHAAPLLRMLGATALVLGLTSVLLAEAKGVLLALGAGVVLAVVLASGTAGRGARLRRVVDRWSARIGLSVGLLVVAAPFVGAVVLDADALRPEVWRRAVAALSAREWLVGLGAQPLRVDREFHARVESSWGAVQAHNQALELLLIAGVPGLVLMFTLVAVLLTVGLRVAGLARGWAVAATVFMVAAGASGPNLTYFGHDLAFVLTAALLVGVAARPRLIRVADDPAGLPAALERVWAAGDAAIVTPPGATLPPAIARALAGQSALPHGTALVVPTSGSTGAPRAVALPHSALAASTTASITALGCTPGERWALALPLQHVAGLQVLARARALGTDVHVVTDPGDPHLLAGAAAHAEHIALVPTQLVRCLDAGVDLTAFRSVLVGGGPLAPERAAQARTQGVRLVQSYGMTETCGGCVYDGQPLDRVDIGIEVDVEVGVEVDAVRADGAGRIRLRGPMRATGYLDTDLADTGRFTADGWFVTDDLGRLAPDGALEVIGRADTMIITGGVKVDPVAVETLLRSRPDVADAAVIAVPDAEWGERVVAVVVPTDPSAPPTLAVLRAHVGIALPSAHAPRELVRTDRIVRDAMGKLSAAERTRLRALRTD